MKKRPFWSMVNKGKPDECWIWLGMLHKKEGYGRVRVPFLSYEERRSNPTCILRGSANGNSRLTEDDVRQMRAEYASGGVTLAALGKKYKLHTSTVCDIINRQCWRHVA